MKYSYSAAYYHACTDGNALDWMFNDAEDFIAGINRIGICKLISNVLVIAYVLMDNHVHFVLHGTIFQCKKFMQSYKTLTGKWISKKYQTNSPLRHLPSQLILIHDEEQLLDTIAYLDRNAIVAGYQYLPQEYAWGSAKYMFQDAANSRTETREIKDFNAKEQQQLFKTWHKIPENWRVYPNGMIDPRCFLEINTLDKLFKSPIKYLFHLSKKLEGRIELIQGTQTFIPDKELRKITQQLAMELFSTTSVQQLDFSSKITIARKLRFNHGSTPKQISRIISLDHETITKFI